MANITKDTFSQGEINTLISALMQFKQAMQEKNALGDDETGEGIRFGYLHHCDRLLIAITESRKDK